MKAYLSFVLAFAAITQGQAYSPTPINRRSMIEGSMTAILMPPSLVLAKDVEDKVEIKKDRVNDGKGQSSPEHDALSEFRIWRRRGSLWLKRRTEREEVSKRKKVSNTMEDTDITLSNNYGRQKIQLFKLGKGSFLSKQ